MHGLLPDSPDTVTCTLFDRLRYVNYTCVAERSLEAIRTVFVCVCVYIYIYIYNRMELPTELTLILWYRSENTSGSVNRGG